MGIRLRHKVHFPKDGSTDLVNQMVNFGAENMTT